MAQLMRCRSCGYVIEEKRLGEVCPACGVPRKMLEPWKDPVSERRRIILGFDLHPIIDHFSVSFAASAFALALFVLAFPRFHGQAVTDVLRAFVGALPVCVAASFVTGLFDGKVRFRRVTTPLLKRKMAFGILFFVLSGTAAALAFTADPFEEWVSIASAALLAGCVLCALVLGRIGAGLVIALFPG